MKLEDIINVKIEKLNAESIKEVARSAQNLANKAYRRWEEKEFRSPAYYGMKKSGGLISFRGKEDLKEQKKELARAVRFLTDRSRTVAGWNEIKKENTEIVNDKVFKQSGENQLSPDDYDRFYTAFEKAAEINPNIETENYKYNVMDALLEELDNYAKDVDELAVDLADQFPQIYEDTKDVDEEDNISTFFGEARE